MSDCVCDKVKFEWISLFSWRRRRTRSIHSQDIERAVEGMWDKRNTLWGQQRKSKSPNHPNFPDTYNYQNQILSHNYTDEACTKLSEGCRGVEFGFFGFWTSTNVFLSLFQSILFVDDEMYIVHNNMHLQTYNEEWRVYNFLFMFPCPYLNVVCGCKL